MVASFLDVHEAHLVCGALQARGIDASVADDNVIAQNWLYATACGGVKVKVPVEQAAEARAVLASEIGAVPAGEELAAEEPEAQGCPECGSARTHRRKLSWWSFATLIAGFGLLPLPSRKRVCEACGASWTAREW